MTTSQFPSKETSFLVILTGEETTTTTITFQTRISTIPTSLTTTVEETEILPGSPRGSTRSLVRTSIILLVPLVTFGFNKLIG